MDAMSTAVHISSTTAPILRRVRPVHAFPTTLRSVLISSSHLRLNRSSHLPSKRCMNFSCSHTWYCDPLYMVRQAIHLTKEANTLMLKWYFYTQFAIIPTCCDLSWSSSGSYISKTYINMDGLLHALKLVQKVFADITNLVASVQTFYG
jgi:hypothetical protein